MTQETLIQVERKQVQGWLRTLANCHSNLFLKDYVGHINQSVAEIKEALMSLQDGAQPELIQQPASIDEMHSIGNGIMYGEQPKEQQPDVFDDDIEVIGSNEIRTRWRLEKGTKLYTTPPQRTAAVGEDTQRAWFGLTGLEIEQIQMSKWKSHELINWIEAKLKEKNT